MVCPKCKRSIPEGMAFCPHCGVSVKSADTPPNPPKETKEGGDGLLGLAMLGVLAVIVVVWISFPGSKIGGKSLVFWVAFAGYLFLRDLDKRKRRGKK